jgi:hypothetical protein
VVLAGGGWRVVAGGWLLAGGCWRVVAGGCRCAAHGRIPLLQAEADARLVVDARFNCVPPTDAFAQKVDRMAIYIYVYIYICIYIYIYI